MHKEINTLNIFHQDNSNYCFATDKNKVTLRLRVRKDLNLEDVTLWYGVKYKFLKHDTAKLEVKYENDTCKFYEINLTLEDRRVAYCFTFKYKGETYYYTREGINLDFDETWSYYLFQIGFINDDDVVYQSEYSKNKIFYQVFVERFNIGNKDKNMDYVNMSVEDKPNRMSFMGGDLQGVIDKIDYLKELGINVLYLNPIFESNSNHKYNIADYKMIDHNFGDDEVFKKLVDLCHENGILVVLDAVFNHCATDNPIFEDVCEKGKESKYYDWFFVHGDKAKVSMFDPNYEGFGLGGYMPKLNTANKEVRDYLIDVGTYFIKKFDIDGWRLDVGDEVSHNFWHEFRNACKAIKKDFLIIGEVWFDPRSFLHGDQFDSVMNYTYRKAILRYFKKGFNIDKLVYDITDCYLENTSTISKMMFNLLDSHDTPRFYFTLNHDVDLLKQAVALQFAYVGNPSIYYGDEYHLDGDDDPDCRRGMIFDKDKIDVEYLEFIKKFISIRKSEKALYEGEISLSTNNNKYFSMTRFVGNEKVTLILNNKVKPLDLSDLNYSKVLISNRFDEDKKSLKNKGFVIIKE